MAAAETTLARWGRAAPHDPNLLSTRVGFAAWKGDYALASLRADTLAAAQVGKQILAGASRSRSARRWRAVQGKIAEAERRLRTSASLNEERGAIDQFWRSTIALALLDLRYRNRPADAIAIVTDAMTKHPLTALDASDRPYSVLAVVYATAGQPDEADAADD